MPPLHHPPKSAEAEENKRVAAFWGESVCAKSVQAIEKKGGYKTARNQGSAFWDCIGAYAWGRPLGSL